VQDLSTSYPDNLTREQFELIEPLLPAAKPGGRRREVDLWEVLNAIFYVLTNGCKWRSLPKDFPKWQTVYTYLRNWRKDGTWLRLHDQLHEWTRVSELRAASPSELIIDSQSAKSVAMLSLAIGYDAGKQVKGGKRFATVDTLGLILRVLVTAANVLALPGQLCSGGMKMPANETA
jgi:transposase